MKANFNLSIRMRALHLSGWAAAAVLTAGVAAGAGTPPGARPLRVGFFQSGIETTTLDNVSTYQQIVFLKQVGQTLIETGPLGEVLPGLASSWTISPDRRVYTFKLRKAFFHDGSPVAAADVVQSLKRAVSAKGNVASYYLDVIESLSGANPGILAKDAETVEVRLTRAYSPLLTMLSSGALIVVKPGPAGTPPNATGPYKVGARTGVRVRLSAFDQYVGAYPPRLPEVELISDSELAAVKRPPAADELPDYELLAFGPRLKIYDTAKYERVSTPAMVTGGFFINPRLPKYKSRAARLALLSLLHQVTDQPLFAHPGRALTDVFPKGMIAHQEGRPSFERLKTAMEKAPLPPKTAKICFNYHTMVGAEGAFHDAILKKSGHDVAFIRSPYLDALKDWQTYECDAFFMTWQSVFLDPEAGLAVYRILAPFASPTAAAKFKSLSETAAAEASPPVRAKLYGELADLVFDEAVALPVFQPDHVEFLNKEYARGNSVYRYQQMVSEIYRK